MKAMQALVASLLFCLVAAASSAQEVVGDWQGTLKTGPGELRIIVHVTRNDKRELMVTMDSPDQGVKGIQTTGVSAAEGALKFDVAQISGGYQGKFNPAGTAINGTWTQAGNSLPLDLARAVLAPERKRVVKGSDIDGDWAGAIGGALDVTVHITTYDDGLSAALDVPAQGAAGLPMTAITRTGSTVQLELKQVGASFTGTLSADLSTLTGTWSQLGNSPALVLQRMKKP
jgi:hypothetical protein